MTIDEFFENFLTENVNLKKICDGECDGSDIDCDICKVTSRHKALAENLKNELKILQTEDEENQPSTFLTGSYRRHTMIHPPKDVDFFIVLDRGEYHDDELDKLISPEKLLNKLYETLESIFEEEDIKLEKQHHSVMVIYDKTFSIDVIPAFETDDKKAYMIADIEDNKNEYIISNPKIHYQYINDINDFTSVNGKKRFKRVVRLLKFIKRKAFHTEKVKIRSFHFELLAAEILGSDKLTSYSEAIHKFLSKASDYFDKPFIIDPANPQNKIDDYIENFSSETKEAIKKKLKDPANIAQLAVDHEKNDEPTKAIQEWEKIFRENESSSNSGSGPTTIYSPPSKPWCSN